MPGHKGAPAAIPPFAPVLRYDFTEVEGADDLQHPSAAIAQSEANMAALYGSGATLYSASGSTSCIEAMLSLFVPLGSKVVMARNCHVSAVRSLAFLDAQPIWVLPENGRPAPAAIDTALSQSGAKCVYITSPDYYGRIADVTAIAKICQKHGSYLIVDNAHGAHLPFLPGNLHPLQNGADACCDSAHKTLPCLTPASMLHLRDSTLKPAARRALNLYSSTSPSYLVLQSMDLAAALLAENPPAFATAAAKLADAAAANPAIVQPGDDPLKLCLYPAQTNTSFAQAVQALQATGITPELADGEHIVLMASPYNSDADFANLQRALASLPKQPATQALPPPRPLPLPQSTYGIRQAVYSRQTTVAVQNSIGCIAAEVCAPCPPGIPVVMPGEKITAYSAELLLKGGINTVGVVE